MGAAVDTEDWVLAEAILQQVLHISHSPNLRISLMLQSCLLQASSLIAILTQSQRQC